MEGVDWLRHEFSGVCKTGRSTHLAIFLAWRHILAMPSPSSPGFDGEALSKACDELASLLSAPGSDSWSVVSWASRNGHLGALPSWRALPMGKGSGEWDEDDGPTGPLDGFHMFFWTRGRNEACDWTCARNAWSGLGVGRVWVSALAPQSRRAGWVLWCMEAAKAMSAKGCAQWQGKASATLAVGAPNKPWGERWDLSGADWLMACPEKTRDGAASLIEAWARHVDAKCGVARAFGSGELGAHGFEAQSNCQVFPRGIVRRIDVAQEVEGFGSIHGMGQSRGGGRARSLSCRSMGAPDGREFENAELGSQSAGCFGEGQELQGLRSAVAYSFWFIIDALSIHGENHAIATRHHGHSGLSQIFVALEGLQVRKRSAWRQIDVFSRWFAHFQKNGSYQRDCLVEQAVRQMRLGGGGIECQQGARRLQEARSDGDQAFPRGGCGLRWMRRAGLRCSFMRPSFVSNAFDALVRDVFDAEVEFMWSQRSAECGAFVRLFECGVVLRLFRWRQFIEHREQHEWPIPNGHGAQGEAR